MNVLMIRSRERALQPHPKAEKPKRYFRVTYSIITVDSDISPILVVVTPGARRTVTKPDRHVACHVSG